MSFEIIRDRLNSDFDIKVLEVRNEFYNIKIFYYGDYKKDFENNACSVENISISCKPIDYGFEISYLNGYVAISIPYEPFMLAKEVDVFKSKLDEAKASALELENLMEKYFPIKQTGS